MAILKPIFEAGWPIVFPIVWSLLLTLLCSSVFLLVRWALLDRWAKKQAGKQTPGLYVSFGTELFAILVAVDLSICLGLVEVWRLGSIGNATTVYRVAAAILLPLTCYLCAVSLQYERQSFQAWWKWKTVDETSNFLERRSLETAYSHWWTKATMARMLVGWSHLAWIVKAPRFTIFG